MIFRLLAINIDGTIIQPNGRIHKSTKEAIEYVQNKGIYVTLVSSRSFASAKKVAKALKIDSIIVTQRGAFIADSADHPILINRIPEEITFDVVRLLEGFPSQIRIIDDKFSLSNKYKLNNNIFAKAVYNSGDSVFYPQQFVDSLSDTILDEPVSPLKIEVYFESHKDLLDANKVTKEMFPEIDTLPLNELRMDIVSSGVSKLNGLLYLGDHLGISISEMVVIGDDMDDLEMIETAGLGVAMGNSPNELKRAADWVTRSNNQHGVAYMVKEHFRKQQPIEFLKKMNIIK
ncbi:Cof-type HAD-IIB family hydrolase [Bacillus massilinigeriensis]|uniref:Cof-type HAD-IIB family hydrolase n=1 Tax=Bacillus massilionigeriensis TaxID=1805475 RepID=UPI00096AF961|nr:Cof-type HAD-IIB family hydrolase [Bacillus massilionigeriensis]